MGFQETLEGVYYNCDRLTCGSPDVFVAHQLIREWVEANGIYSRGMVAYAEAVLGYYFNPASYTMSCPKCKPEETFPY